MEKNEALEESIVSSEAKDYLSTELLPTKELLRQQRKKNYAAFKNARKQEKAAQKEEHEKSKLRLRAKRDERLRSMIRKGSDLEHLEK